MRKRIIPLWIRGAHLGYGVLRCRRDLGKCGGVRCKSLRFNGERVLTGYGPGCYYHSSYVSANSEAFPAEPILQDSSVQNLQLEEQ